jgi:hypothetical protein
MSALQDIVTKDSTDRSVKVRIIDSTDGTPETGVVFDTSGIDLWYRREGAAKVEITEATLAALTTAHADGGFLHISDGDYRLDLPDAAFATGANYVDFGGTVTGMVVIGGRVRLVNFDLETALQNVNITQISDDATAADNAEAFFDGTGYSGTNNVIPTVTTLTGHTAQTGDNFARLGAPAGASVSADIAEVKTDSAAILLDTNELQTDLADGGRLDLLIDTAAEKTGMKLASDGLDSVVIETGLNARQALSITVAAAGGVLAGAATTTVTIAAAGVPATNRITATVDADGNRSDVTLSAPS